MRTVTFNGTKITTKYDLHRDNLVTEGTINQIMTKNMSSVFLQTSDLALRSQNTYADIFGALLGCWSF